MTNEQTVISIEREMEALKQQYMNVLLPISINFSSKNITPTLSELLECQKNGNMYFNFVENFVGNSGLLGAHANGKWVTGFAETCQAVLESYILYIKFLRSHSAIFNGSFQEPNSNAYANMQRMTKEYLQKDKWKELEKAFKSNKLPTNGFKYRGANNLSETPKWQLILGLTVGLFFAIAVLCLAVFIPSPTSSQFFIFRGLFAISLSAIAAIIPGLLNVESRFQKFSIKATGAIAVFILVWLLNPPALVSS